MSLYFSRASIFSRALMKATISGRFKVDWPSDLNDHAIRCLVESSEVVCYLRPIGNRAIVARSEAENRFR